MISTPATFPVCHRTSSAQSTKALNPSRGTSYPRSILHREPLCDITVAFCIRSRRDLMSIQHAARALSTPILRSDAVAGTHDHATLLSQTLGYRHRTVPSGTRRHQSLSPEHRRHLNFPRIACRDFFSLSPGDSSLFPPPKMDVERPETVNEPIPQFDAIVGNFPYVSADQIEEQRRLSRLHPATTHRRLVQGLSATVLVSKQDDRTGLKKPSRPANTLPAIVSTPNSASPFTPTFTSICSFTSPGS